MANNIYSRLNYLDLKKKFEQTIRNIQNKKKSYNKEDWQIFEFILTQTKNYSHNGIKLGISSLIALIDFHKDRCANKLPDGLRRKVIQAALEILIKHQYIKYQKDTRGKFYVFNKDLPRY